MNTRELGNIIQRLRSIGVDTETIEVKCASGGLPKSTKQTLSAFANGKGGLLILGLDEKKNFSPSIPFHPQLIQDALGRCLSEDLIPPLRDEIQILPFENKELVLVEIAPLPPNDRPCYLREKGQYNGAYIRSGDGDRLLQKYEIDRLLEGKKQPRWDQEPICESSFEDLNKELVQALLRRERTVHSRIFSRLKDEEALIKLNVLFRSPDGHLCPTLAGLLALGDHPQQYFPQLMLSYAVYPGKNKSSDGLHRRTLDSGTLIGSIPDIIADGVYVVAKNMRTGGAIRGAFREELHDYPLVAVREALANALMHRDYSPESRGTQVELNLYEDRMEISNPGGLFGNVTVESLGSEGASSSRNSFLAQILEATPCMDDGFVAENRGSGYQEILSLLQQNKMPPPKVKNSLTQFSLTFERRHDADDLPGIPAASARTRVIEYLRCHASASSRELAATAGIGLSGVRKILTALLNEGRITRSEPPRSPKQKYKLK